MSFDINSISTSTKILKPWGEEIIYTPADSKYTFKQIKINDGTRFSLQSHSEKIETFVLIEGEADLTIGLDLDHLETVHMEIKKGYNIAAGIVHRITGIKNAVVLESSVPETGTTFRYQDDYHRTDETEDVRHLENRGWTPKNN